MPRLEGLEKHSEIYAQREAFRRYVEPFAEEIIGQSLNGSFSSLRPRQRRAFLRIAVSLAAATEFGRTLDELKRKQPGSRGYPVTYDPLESFIMLQLGMAGIRDAEVAMSAVGIAASVLRKAYHG